MGESGPVLTWNFPSLVPGVYQLPYSVQVNDNLPTGTVLENIAQVSFLGGASRAATAVVAVLAPISLKIGVYNEAGELIKTILATFTSQAAQSLQLSAPVETTLNGVISVYIQGQLVASWDGNNSQGAPVTNGKYFITAQSTDPTGVVTTVTQAVMVSRSFSTVTVEVYNEAGEVVRHLYENVADAADSSIQSVQLSASVIDPDGASSPGIPFATSIRVSIPNDDFTVVWDGRVDGGSPATSGQYFVEATWTGGTEGGTQTITREIMVQNDGRGMVGGTVYAQPNILKGGRTSTVFAVTSPLSLTVKVRLYSMAGELLAFFQGPLGSNQAPFNAAGLASGCYIASVELDDGSGPVARQTTHL
ncbi:MAG TPA: hypothetical protein VK859_05160, partial [bacterium]|nr:hypothetical protein [bacterium]